jgi:hypothetical protein
VDSHVFGCVLAVTMLLGTLAEMSDLTFGTWLGAILSSAAFGILMAVSYYDGQRLLRRHGYSLHDDSDFED